MSDLLSAASLLVTIVAVLYGLWYPELKEVAQTAVPAHAADRKKPREAVSAALFGKALPLTAISFLLSAVFSPAAYKVLAASVQNVQSKGWGALSDYDAVQAALVLVVAISLGLGFVAFGQTIALCGKRGRLK